MVKEGFILWAFLLNIVWLFYKKVFKWGFLILLLMVGVFFLESSGFIYPSLAQIIQMTISVLVGFEAGDWYEKTLKKRGYKFLGHASGKDVKVGRR